MSLKIMDFSRALIVTVERKKGPISVDHQNETSHLVKALGISIVGHEIFKIRTVRSATLMGSGWVQNIAELIEKTEATMVIIDPDLSPLQQRNLEKIWNLPVWDRTALILKIFAQRARSAAGKLQVSLAELLYQKNRLVRAWTHLERQRGGFGFIAGPGESQLELDQRMLQDKILKVKSQLEKVRQTRSLNRKGRESFMKVTLVGYTNAGKSTLFNKLTKADVFQADMPFATLDSTVRKVHLPSGRFFLLSDTVGFISNLPKFLRLAFQATLEEILEADLLIHVRDIANPSTVQQRQDVLTILEEMSCDVPILEVLNKIDLIPVEDAEAFHQEIKISARTGQGVQNLLTAIDIRMDELHPPKNEWAPSDLKE